MGTVVDLHTLPKTISINPEAVGQVRQFLRERMVEKARKRGISYTKMFNTVFEAMSATRVLIKGIHSLEVPDHWTRLKAAEFSWKEIYGLGVARKTEMSGPEGAPIPVKHTHIAEVSEKREELKKLVDMRAEWDRKKLRGRME